MIGMLLQIKRTAKKILFSVLPSSTVLMFHHINDGKIIVKSGCRLKKDKFLEIIDSGIPFISMDEYTTFRPSWKNPCTITFDDGLKDMFRVAYPELKDRSIPFAVFIVTDFLDQDGYISTEELLTLANDPLVTIGSHGTSHKVLRGMDEDAQRDELIRSKRMLEEKVKMPIRHFAYSHGQYDETTLGILHSKKIYDYAFAAGNGKTNLITKKDRFTLPRLDIEDGVENYRILGKRKKQLVQIL